MDNPADDDFKRQIASLMEIYQELEDEDQDALLRLATYLASRPREYELTLEKLDELFGCPNASIESIYMRPYQQSDNAALVLLDQIISGEANG